MPKPQRSDCDRHGQVANGLLSHVSAQTVNGRPQMTLPGVNIIFESRVRALLELWIWGAIDVAVDVGR